ncbi:ABC transporter substrate-binding protein [Gracilinema caldarium]|uniref:substrate-binding periplasmic protein n=1 Tax=Gracilinema caldarium TaxID=215591 RepID=UPI0026EE42B9|nr:transporter substrate-binding domain-containing protein [Gracilinema caldarium]
MRSIIIFYILLATLLTAQGENTLNFAIGEWNPHTGTSLPEYGFVTAVVRKACLEAGLSPTFYFFPWPRAEYLVQKGDFFATFPYLQIPEREDFFYFSDPLFISKLIIVRNKDSKRTAEFKYSGRIEELKSYRIGTTAGTKAVVVPLRSRGILVEESASLDFALKKLAKGRLDFVIDEYKVILDASKNLFRGQENPIDIIEKPFAENLEYCLMVSKAYPNAQVLLKRFNEGLRKVLGQEK